MLDSFRLVENVSHLLRRAHFRAEGLFTAELGEWGITPRQKALLVTAYQRPGAPIHVLAEAIALDRQSTAEMTHRLVERGLLERRRSEQDRRAYALFITEAGVDVLRNVMPVDAAIEEQILEPLPAEYRPLFLKCLRLMVERELPEQGNGHAPGRTADLAGSTD
jgi:DNA-binding MarR family transcriptional regulator